MQVDELPGLPQAIEELAEILLHRGAPKGAVVGGRALSYLGPRLTTIQARQRSPHERSERRDGLAGGTRISLRSSGLPVEALSARDER